VPQASYLLRRVALSLLDFLKEYIYPKQALEAMVRSEERPWSATV
jgi:hypothetical protein